MDADKITFVPQSLAENLKSQIKYANERLVSLQEYVSEYGETWADVLEYAEKGADFKKQARLSECRAWMDENKTPSYLRDTMEAEAIADLGNDALDYWEGLARLLQVRTYNTNLAPILDLKNDVDASGSKWVVSSNWIKRQEEAIIITMPDSIADDYKRFKDITQAIADFENKGYYACQLISHLKSLIDYGKLNDGIDYEAWLRTDNADNDMHVPKNQEPEEIE